MFRPDDLFLQMIAFGLLHFYDVDGREVSWSDLSDEDQRSARKVIYETLTPTFNLTTPGDTDESTV